MVGEVGTGTFGQICYNLKFPVRWGGRGYRYFWSTQICYNLKFPIQWGGGGGGFTGTFGELKSAII